MKRLIPAILAFVMLFCLCACGSSAPASTEPSQPAETAAPENTAPEDPAAQAAALIAAGETEENLNAALELYQVALDSDPENLDAILGTVDVMIRKGNFENALKWLKAFTLTMPDNAAIGDKIRELESGNIKDRDGKERLATGYRSDGTVGWTRMVTYDEQGREIGVILRDANGNETDRAEGAYNEHGDAVRSFIYVLGQDNSSIKVLKYEFNYEYDENGKWLVRERSDGQRMERTLDEHGNAVKTLVTMNGQPETTVLSEYDENDNPIRSEYYRQGNLVQVHTAVINEQGMIQEQEDWYADKDKRGYETERFVNEYEDGRLVKSTVYRDDAVDRIYVYHYNEDGVRRGYDQFAADGKTVIGTTMPQQDSGTAK